MLAEQQQVPPDLAALVGPAPDPRRPVRVGWFRLRVPQREQLGGARRELRAAVARQLRGRGGGAVLPVQPGIAAPHRKLRTEAPLHVAKKVLRPARDDAWVGVAPAELFEVVHQPLVGERVVPLGPIQQRHVVGVSRRDEHRVGEQPVGKTPRHGVGADVEPEAQRVAVVVRAPVHHPAPVGTLPPVELRVGRPFSGEPDTLRLGLGKQRHGPLRVRAGGEIAHAARRQHRGEREGLPRHVGELRAQVAQPVLPREPPRRPRDPRQRLVIEDPRQHVRERRPEAHLAVADRLNQGVARRRRAVLDVGQHLQGAFRAPPEVGVRGETGEGGVQVLAVHLEAALLQVGIPDVGVIAGEPVQRPAARWGESHLAPGDALLSHLEVDLKLRRLRQRHPHLAREARPWRAPRGQEARRAHERAAAIGHTRPGGGRVQAGDRDAHEIAAPVGLLVQGRGRGVDRDRRSGERGKVPADERQAAQPADEPAAIVPGLSLRHLREHG